MDQALVQPTEPAAAPPPSDDRLIGCWWAEAGTREAEEEARACQALAEANLVAAEQVCALATEAEAPIAEALRQEAVGPYISASVAHDLAALRRIVTLVAVWPTRSAAPRPFVAPSELRGRPAR